VSLLADKDNFREIKFQGRKLYGLAGFCPQTLDVPRLALLGSWRGVQEELEILSDRIVFASPPSHHLSQLLKGTLNYEVIWTGQTSKDLGNSGNV
jgi:hypothetical protein